MGTGAVYGRSREAISLIHVTCIKCRRRFELDPVFVALELRKLKTDKPRHYQAVCPSCQATNKVPVAQMKKDLEAVAEQTAAAVQAQAEEPLAKEG